jgi:4a-hydroxytetrahydrobiopterin dehydratase
LAAQVGDADNGTMAATLSDSEIQQALVRLPGWTREGDEIVKWYELASFPLAIEFVGGIAEAAEAADHHPDLDIRYRRVRVALSTHDAGGLTQKDVDLATQIEAMGP